MNEIRCTDGLPMTFPERISPMGLSACSEPARDRMPDADGKILLPNDLIEGVSHRSPLLVGAAPQPGESIGGYLLRLTELNGYKNVAWIFALLKIDQFPFRVTRLASKINELADVARTEAELLRNMVYVIEGDKASGLLRVGETVIQRRAFDLMHQKLCPECLNDEPFLRRSWDLSLLTVCPIHRCNLIDTCPSCRNKLTWLRDAVSVCKCGHDLRTVPTEGAGGPLVDISALVSSGFDSRVCEGSINFEPRLVALSAFELHATLFFLMGSSRDSTNLPGRFIREKPLGERRKIMDRAGKAFSDWPDGLFSFLDEKFGGRSRAKGRLGITRYFGQFYRVAFDPRNDKALTLLREGIEKYLIERLDGLLVTERGRPLVGPKIKRRSKYVTKAEAKQMLGCQGSTIERLIRRGELEAEAMRAGEIKVTKISRASINRYLKKRSGYIGIRELADRLGVTDFVATALIKEGYVPAVQGPHVDGSQALLVTSDALHNFSKDVCRGVPERLEDQSCLGYCWFSEVVQVARLHGISATDLVQNIIDRRIIPHSWSKGGGVLGAMLFSQEDVSRLIRKRHSTK